MTGRKPNTATHVCSWSQMPSTRDSVTITIIPDEDGGRKGGLLQVGDFELEVWYCPFCGDKLSVFPPWVK